MRCPQLVCLFVRYFLQAGGDPIWTLGLSNGPSRWLQLKELNHNLAHSPWKVTADDIYQLTRGDDGANRGDKLSLSELMHAVGIMAHVHALACFIFGAGVRPELEHICPSPYQPCVYSTATSANTNATPATFPLDESGDKSTFRQSSSGLILVTDPNVLADLNISQLPQLNLAGGRAQVDHLLEGMKAI
ncbi:hypothetical protein ACTXT7_002673 [Hymenolepis weldensis]